MASSESNDDDQEICIPLTQQRVVGTRLTGRPIAFIPAESTVCDAVHEPKHSFTAIRSSYLALVLPNKTEREVANLLGSDIRNDSSSSSSLHDAATDTTNEAEVTVVQYCPICGQK